MAVAIEVLAKQLVESGLVDGAELRSLILDLPADRRPKDGEQLTRELVRQRKLTPYQAQQAFAGKAKSLVVGNYIVQDKLGQGGMGTVVKAEHKRMQRMVALKVISPEAMKSPDAVKRFHREVQAAARLIHQNIVTAFDADEFDGRHVLVMELVEGSDLSTHIKKNGPLSVEEAVHCIYEAAKGLEYAHKQGVVHRDIKPGNLLLGSSGVVKILDMGLARLDSTQESAEITSTGQVMGTIDYMAPEQAMNTRQADGRADIYSLGLTFWYLLTAKPAYTGDSIMEKLLAHRERAIPSLREVRSDVTPAIQAIFERMAAKTPEERYATMTALIADLERVKAGETAAPAARREEARNSVLAGQSSLGRGPGSSGMGSAIGVGGSAIGVGGSGVGSGVGSSVNGGQWSPGSPAVAPQRSTDETVDRAGSDTDPDPQPWAFTPAAAPATAARPPAAPASLPARPTPSPWWANVWVLVGVGVGTAILVFALGMLILGNRPRSTAQERQSGPSLVVASRFPGEDSACTELSSRS
jgi:serine/threonine protein kinase